MSCVRRERVVAGAGRVGVVRSTPARTQNKIREIVMTKQIILALALTVSLAAARSGGDNEVRIVDADRQPDVRQQLVRSALARPCEGQHRLVPDQPTTKVTTGPPSRLSLWWPERWYPLQTMRFLNAGRARALVIWTDHEPTV
jgi:hypothetical protein